MKPYICSIMRISIDIIRIQILAGILVNKIEKTTPNGVN